MLSISVFVVHTVFINYLCVMCLKPDKITEGVVTLAADAYAYNNPTTTTDKRDIIKSILFFL